MKQIFYSILIVLLGLSGLAQESTAPKVLIPLIANGSHHRPAIVMLESLLITDQKTPVTGASLLRGADLPLELGVLIDTSNSQHAAPMDAFLIEAKQFANDIIRGPEDRVFFLTFNATPQTRMVKERRLKEHKCKGGSWWGNCALRRALYCLQAADGTTRLAKGYATRTGCDQRRRRQSEPCYS